MFRFAKLLTIGCMDMQLNNLPYPSAPPEPGSCCQLTNEPPPPPPEEQPGGASELRELREVHVSMGLMEEFLA